MYASTFMMSFYQFHVMVQKRFRDVRYTIDQIIRWIMFNMSTILQSVIRKTESSHQNFHMILPFYNIQAGTTLGLNIIPVPCKIRTYYLCLLSTRGQCMNAIYIHINCSENDKTLVLSSHLSVPKFSLVDHFSSQCM